MAKLNLLWVIFAYKFMWKLTKNLNFYNFASLELVKEHSVIRTRSEAKHKCDPNVHNFVVLSRKKNKKSLVSWITAAVYVILVAYSVSFSSTERASPRFNEYHKSPQLHMSERAWSYVIRTLLVLRTAQLF